jgi:phosphoadenosine phosphosulfate reductase
MASIFDLVRVQSGITDSVIVSYSGGKDSAVVLDLCHRYFKTVHAFFMYQVSDLSFQEATLRRAEKKYGIEIYRVPHFENSTCSSATGSRPVSAQRTVWSAER